MDISGGTEINPIVIDLNGYTMSGGIININAVDTTTSSYVTIKNGKLEYSHTEPNNSFSVIMLWGVNLSSGITASSNVLLKNVSVNAGNIYATAAVDGAKLEVVDCTLTGGVPTDDGNTITCVDVYGTYTFLNNVTMTGRMGVTTDNITTVTLKAGGNYTLFGSSYEIIADVTYSYLDVSSIDWLLQSIY